MIILLRWVLIGLTLACLAPSARAHEVRPAYLELRETSPNSFSIAWKQPINAGARLALRPILPPTCTSDGPAVLEPTATAVIERWRVNCTASLKGATIKIEGLERTLTSVYVQANWIDGKSAATLIQPSAPQATLGAGATPALARYILLGIEHILGGLDHLAFVAGLVLLVTGLRRLLISLTAFTLAHSITLALAALGGVSLPAAPVEACIALSIVLVGYEAVRLARGKPGLTAKAPWLAAFGFGLLHGFGFAGALAEIGLPERARAMALLLFNVGVEMGQIAVVALLLAPLFWLRSKPKAMDETRIAGGYILGGAGAFWLIQRLAGVFIPA